MSFQPTMTETCNIIEAFEEAPEYISLGKVIKAFDGNISRACDFLNEYYSETCRPISPVNTKAWDGWFEYNADEKLTAYIGMSECGGNGDTVVDIIDETTMLIRA